MKNKIMNKDVLYISGHDIILLKNKNNIIIKSTEKYPYFKHFFELFIIILILIMILFASFVIVRMSWTIITNNLAIYELGWLTFFIVVHVFGLFLACKIFLNCQAVYAGFNLSITNRCVIGRWGIIPIKRTIKNSAEIVLSLSCFKGDWGCRGEIKFTENDICSLFLFPPYAISTQKKVAKRELERIATWLSVNLPSIKIIVKYT